MQYNTYNITPKQYYQKWVNDVYKAYKNDGITKKEIRSLYPFERIFYDYYLPQLYSISKEGIRIANSILDKLTPEQRYRFLHDFPDMYRDYLPPEIRRQKREIYVRQAQRRKSHL